MSFNTRKETRRSAISFEGVPSMTEQCHAEQCDVHSIMKRFQRTQMLDHVNAFSGEYMNLADGFDFHMAMNQIAEAHSMFETIPSSIRAKFGHDPARFLEWIQDEDNRAEMLEMGFTDTHLPAIEAPEGALPESGTDSKGKGKKPPTDPLQASGGGKKAEPAST
jgi:phage internal scaffolding protein